MPATLYGNCPIWGIPAVLPDMPEGWVLSPVCDDFLRAADPKGNEWYVFENGTAQKIVPPMHEQVELVALAEVPPPSWRVLPASAPDQPHELRFDDEPQISIKGEAGEQALRDLARIFNRRGFTALDFRQVNEVL